MNDDTISRQETINAVLRNLNKEEYQSSWESGAVKVMKDTLEKMPSVDDPQGEWILQENKHHIEKIYLCSNCKEFEAWGESEKYRYCPNCRARMKGVEDDTI